MGWKRILGLNAALLALAVAWFLLANAKATRREREARDRWEKEFGKTDDLLGKYPKAEENDSARQLETLARSIGIDLTQHVKPLTDVRPHSGPEDANLELAGEYLKAEIAKPGGGIAPPQPALAVFLSVKAADLEAITGLLTEKPLPAWRQDLQSPDEAPAPNLLGLIRLQRVLLVRALDQRQKGDASGAGRTLEASWALNGSLRRRREFVSVLIAVAVARLQVGVLRKTDEDSSKWAPRLADLNFREPLIEACVVDHNRFAADFQAARGEPEGDLRRGVVAVERIFETPQMKSLYADYTDAIGADLGRLRSAPLTDSDPLIDTEPTSAGKIIALMSMPNTRNTFRRADRLVVDAELTSKVLEAKADRRKNGNRWPASIPGIEVSKFPGASWRYEVSPGGKMSIAFSQELVSPGPTPTSALPLRFESGP